MIRALSQSQRPPRAWSRFANTQQQLMIDRAWVRRRERQAGTVDGTPAYQQVVLGGPNGYAAKLSTPSQDEQRQADRYQVNVTHTLSVMTDIEILISDFVDVNSRGVLATFRVTADLVERRSAWGELFMQHMSLEILTES